MWRAPREGPPFTVDTLCQTPPSLFLASSDGVGSEMRQIMTRPDFIEGKEKASFLSPLLSAR
jgi:hypothetical protein